MTPWLQQAPAERGLLSQSLLEANPLPFGDSEPLQVQNARVAARAASTASMIS
jgi:hypothetical protein